MKYTGYKLQFSTGIHIGQGRLEDAGSFFGADTLFSALCHESLEDEDTADLERLVQAIRADRLRLSDALPYYENTLYIPKPKMQFPSENRSENSAIKKTMKKLTHIPADQFEKYAAGEMDVLSEYQKLHTMGTQYFRTIANVETEGDTVPYSVGVYHFSPGWGLYVIIGYEDDETLYLVEDLLIALGYSGIGGKRSAGLGKYTLMPANLSEPVKDRLCTEGNNAKYMLLSGSMAAEEDLDEVLKDGSYLLQKRSGFVAGRNDSERPMKKKDSFFFQSGSVFNRTFHGVLQDVSFGGSHPVYRYGKPIFMEVPR